MIKNPPAMQASGFNPWVGKIPWRRIWQPFPVFLPGESLGTEEPGELQSMVSQRVRHNWATKHSTVISKTSDQSQLKKILQNTKAAAAKSLQSDLDSEDLESEDSVWPHRWQPTRLPRPWDSQTRTLEWVAISFSNAWKSKVKMKSLSHVWPSVTPWTEAYQAPLSMRFSRQE